jgi:hypothetical protein
VGKGTKRKPRGEAKARRSRPRDGAGRYTRGLRARPAPHAKGRAGQRKARRGKNRSPNRGRAAPLLDLERWRLALAEPEPGPAPGIVGDADLLAPDPHQEVAHELWRRGELSWKLRDYQLELYDTIWRFLRTGRFEDDVPLPSRKGFIYCHRRFGKSFVCFTVATEVGLGKAPEVWPDLRRIIRFMAPTTADLEEIYLPIAEDLLDDCPDDLRPVWQTTRGRGHYFFPTTGSRLFLFGVDAKNYRKARGKRCHLAVPDEVGSCEPGHPGGIEHVVNAIIMPQTFGVNGRVIMPTTPAETPGHPSVALRAQCQAAGAFIRRTIEDTEAELQELFGEGIVEEYAREAGGRESSTFRREYRTEEVIDAQIAICAEFSEHEASIVVVPPVPRYFFPLVSMDPAFADDHAIGFGWWDFERAKLVIWDEAYLQGETTDVVATTIKDKEAELWPWAALETKTNDHGRYLHEPWRTERRPIRRYSDTELRLIADLTRLHGLAFAPTAKDHKEAQVNELRIFAKSHRLEIHPRCTKTIEHLRCGVWNKKRTEFARMPGFGHFDGVDMAIYMLRNAPRALNPFPDPYAAALLDPSSHFVPPQEIRGEPERTPLAGATRGIFRRPTK